METLYEYFNRVASQDWWRVSIELIFIGLVVYWAVDFLEGTRGERLFRGVIFILIVGFLILKLVVGHLQLERLQYLYSGFLIGVLIIAVAAFQPEVRRAMMRIGQGGFWSTSAQPLSRTVEELTNAVSDLSSVRVGAIIVIERRVALGEFIETGVRVDAKVTSELLKTIFHPGSALHDMAVVIRGDMSGIGLGSRHRAAMGITAGSDASCVVVSEETGIISLVENGKLTRNVDEDGLKKYLANVLS